MNNTTRQGTPSALPMARHAGAALHYGIRLQNRGAGGERPDAQLTSLLVVLNSYRPTADVHGTRYSAPCVYLHRSNPVLSRPLSRLQSAGRPAVDADKARQVKAAAQAAVAAVNAGAAGGAGAGAGASGSDADVRAAMRAAVMAKLRSEVP